MFSVPSSPTLVPRPIQLEISELPSLPVSRPPTPPSREDSVGRVFKVLPNPAQRDDTYYLETICFRVEDNLFNVPKYHFVKSSDRFMKENDPEGLSETPLVLNGISKIEFQRFLKVLYPLEFVPSLNKPTEEWISVLKLSTKWHFNTVRELALNQLTGVAMNPVDRVVLGKQFDVWKWLRSGYVSLAVRSEMISLEEAKRIGYSTTHTLYRTREEASRLSRPARVHDIERAFAQEKRAMKMVEAAYSGVALEAIEKVPHSPYPPSPTISVVASADGKKKKKGKKGKK